MQINFLKKIKKPKAAALTHAPEIGEQVTRDWKLMLAVFTILMLVAVFFDGYLLMRISRDDFFKSPEVTETTPASSDRKILLDASGFFDMRASEYEAMKNASSTEIDPSL